MKDQATVLEHRTLSNGRRLVLIHRPRDEKPFITAFEDDDARHEAGRYYHGRPFHRRDYGEHDLVARFADGEKAIEAAAEDNR